MKKIKRKYPMSREMKVYIEDLTNRYLMTDRGTDFSVDIHNFINRNYIHERKEVLSFRVRSTEKQIFQKRIKTTSKYMALRIRRFLLEVDYPDSEYNKMTKEDSERLLKDAMVNIGIRKKDPEQLTKEELFTCAMWIKDNGSISLDLSEVISTKLLGYEKEFFVLLCQKFNSAVVTCRVLYRDLTNNGSIDNLDEYNEPILLEDLIRSYIMVKN